MDDRYPQFVRHDVLAVDLARGIGIDYERIKVTRPYIGDAIYVMLDKPSINELHNAGYFLLPRRPYGVTIVIYEGTEEWHRKLHLVAEPWEVTERQQLRWEFQHQMALNHRALIHSLAIPPGLLEGADPPGLQA